MQDRSLPITAEALEAAKERLVASRATHLDQLADKLSEPRVRRVVAPIMLGQRSAAEASDRDLSYVEDLGLVVRTGDGPEVANGIYREVIPRELTFMAQVNLAANYKPAWYITDDHRLDLPKLLAAFQEFFRENSEAWIERFQYKEAAPHLILMAFLQRVLNGGADLAREFATGTRRVDLCVTYAGRNYPVELKILRGEKSRTEGLRQLADYVDKLGADEGWLVLFDRTPGKSWDERIYWETEKHAGRPLHVVGA